MGMISEETHKVESSIEPFMLALSQARRGITPYALLSSSRSPPDDNLENITAM